MKRNAKPKNQIIDQLEFRLICLKFMCNYKMFAYFNLDYQCNCCKGQHCFLTKIEKIKKERDNNKACTAVLTDFSEAFDCHVTWCRSRWMQKNFRKRGKVEVSHGF